MRNTGRVTSAQVQIASEAGTRATDALRNELVSMLEATEVPSRYPQLRKDLARVADELQRLFGHHVPPVTYPNESIGCFTSVFVAIPGFGAAGYFLLHVLGWPFAWILRQLASGFFFVLGLIYGDTANKAGDAIINWTLSDAGPRWLAALFLGPLCGYLIWRFSRHRMKQALRKRIEFLMRIV